MFDFFRKRLQSTIANITNKQNNLKEEIFNILIDSEVYYDLAEQISQEAFDEFQITNNYKKALSHAITKYINTTHNNLKRGIVLFVGFQGHGKTTNVSKLADRLIKQNFKVAITSLDTERPAAIEQLKENADRFNIPYISLNMKPNNPIDIAKELMNILNNNPYDYVLVDTTGANSMNQDNLDSLKDLIKILKPSEVILVINSMLGHSMFQILESWKGQIPITGSIMTNVDGDKKGGSFLSFYYIMNIPILFISNGEKIHHLERFNATSITNILLGEIDLEGLEDLVATHVPKNVEEIFLTKIMEGVFTFNELLLFVKQTSNIGIGNIMSRIGASNMSSDPELAKKNIKIMTSMIQSMTNKERNVQVTFTESRFRRIALGSGNSVQTVKQMYQSYEQTKKQMMMLTALLKKGGDPMQMLNMLKGIIK